MVIFRKGHIIITQVCASCVGNREEKGNKMVTEDRLLCVPPPDCPLPAEGMFTEQLLCARTQGSEEEVRGCCLVENGSQQTRNMQTSPEVLAEK